MKIRGVKKCAYTAVKGCEFVMDVNKIRTILTGTGHASVEHHVFRL